MTTVQFPAGTYYIGDPCYAFQGDNWHSILQETDYFDNIPETVNMWAGSTAYGDGCYMDQIGNEYPVDAGLIGIMPIQMCDFGDIRWENGNWIDERGITHASGEKFQFKLGNVVTFDKSFFVEYADGKFAFGHIIIDTDPEDDFEWFDED